LDNKDKIFFFTAFKKESLSPSYPTTSTIETISKDIGKTKKFILHLKKKKLDNKIESDSSYFNIKSIFDK
jgi:hypothetical protein